MAGYVYCMYSTQDGVPRYVAAVEDKVSHRFKEHVVAALEKEAGQLYDWMRETWRQDYDVSVYMLQEGIAAADLPMFENYWIAQFDGLLNAGPSPAKEKSLVATQIVQALQAQLEELRKKQTFQPKIRTLR